MIQNFVKIHEEGMIFISGTEQIFSDIRTRFESKDKLESLAKKLKILARKNNIPIAIALNLPRLKRYSVEEYVELYDLGIYDAFACYSDKVMTTKVFAYDAQDLKRDFDIKIVKNKTGKTGTRYFSLYQETRNI